MSIKGCLDLFRLCPPPPPSTICSTQIQSTCHYMVNHYVKIWHVRRGEGGANNMHPLSWGDVDLLQIQPEIGSLTVTI